MATSRPLHAERGGRLVALRLGAPIQRADLAVADRLRQAIHRDGLRGGDKLPSENAIAEALHLSRDPVHRALVALAEEHLVEARRGSGWYVL